MPASLPSNGTWIARKEPFEIRLAYQKASRVGASSCST